MKTETVSIANLTKEERLRMQLYVETQHDGGNPSQLLELLAQAIEINVWEKLTNGEGNSLTFFEFVERPYPDGIGLAIDDLKTLIKLKHQYERKERFDSKIAERMDNMRRVVTDLLHPKMAEPGRPDLQLNQFIKPDNIRLNNSVKLDYGTEANYTIRRLKRDRPDLAEKVIANELSANAAAIEAGFRIKSITIPLDPERAARSIRQHFTEQQIRELIELL